MWGGSPKFPWNWNIPVDNLVTLKTLSNIPPWWTSSRAGTKVWKLRSVTWHFSAQVPCVCCLRRPATKTFQFSTTFFKVKLNLIQFLDKTGGKYTQRQTLRAGKPPKTERTIGRRLHVSLSQRCYLVVKFHSFQCTYETLFARKDNFKTLKKHLAATLTESTFLSVVCSPSSRQKLTSFALEIPSHAMLARIAGFATIDSSRWHCQCPSRKPSRISFAQNFARHY